MKWFKHMTASGDDPDIDDAVSTFGTVAYYVFFRTLEIMSREFDYENPGKNVFSVVYLRSKYRCTWGTVGKCLTFFESRGRIFFNCDDDCKLGKVTLYCPKLKTLCDEHTRKVLGKKSGVSQELIREKSHLEEEEDKEEDISKDIRRIKDENGWFDKKVWNAFIRHRKKLKSPMTLEAELLALEELKKFKDSGMDPIGIVKSAIVNGWKGLYPANQKSKKTDEQEWIENA